MMYHYLISDRATGEQHLAEASSPAVAIADAATERITADRVDGAVLELLKKTLPVKRIAGKAAKADNPEADEVTRDTNNEKPEKAANK